MCYECAEQAGEDGFAEGLEQGRARTFEEVLEHAATFEAKMRKRGRLSNAAGVARFAEYLTGEMCKTSSDTPNS